MTTVNKEITNVKNESGPTDEQLIARFQQGDAYAYDLLVKRYRDPLMNYIFRFLGDRIDAEDILQETFLRLYKNKHYYKEIAKFSTWIYTIAGNLAKTELRKRKRRNIFSIHNFMSTEKDYELPDKGITPDKYANSAITDTEIQKAIAKLSPKFKQVILLRDVQGFSYEEISQIVNIPLGTVKSRVNRARLKLQYDLKKILKDVK
ncbi:MAG: sigma-70 family RNA polymerase sigma factor [Calditrichaeota bacterium]|nr:MAG: RNA polymerase subunit sigma-24 [Calditrichota bacterium]MBL1205496.1 sigma-70 family RNA polymerase sigma factor [Calditrichota bacterium]NOG45324.1 sigma-70 family RNA polymerase sigma factor [Calditrichota bacterium]